MRCELIFYPPYEYHFVSQYLQYVNSIFLHYYFSAEGREIKFFKLDTKKGFLDTLRGSIRRRRGAVTGH